MKEHDNVSTGGWLQAYYDDELDAHDRSQVEAHLAGCATCRAELAEIRALSSLLQEAPAAPVRLSGDRFAAQVALRLVRRPAPSPAQRAVAIGWRAAPVLLVAAYLFFQVASIVTTGLLVLGALSAGKVPLASLVPSTPQSGIASDILGALSGLGLNAIGEPVLGILGAQRFITGFSFASFLFTVFVGLALWSWLALRQVRQRSGFGDQPAERSR